MTDNYDILVQNNLKKLYQTRSPDLARCLPAHQQGERFSFPAFGRTCEIAPDGVRLDSGPCPSVLGILISLYALNARPDECLLEPLKAFKEIPDATPYTGAFTSHTEQLLVPHVDRIKKSVNTITRALNGTASPDGTPGDFSFVVHPLPKIALCCIFYEADEDFPASVTCLFSNNARLFLPVDGLADVGEYCSRAILELAG